MTEPTKEAQAELDAINAEFKARGMIWINPKNAEDAIMLALDRHHGRTPPDPMVAKAERLLRNICRDGVTKSEFDAFVAHLHKEFPDG